MEGNSELKGGTTDARMMYDAQGTKEEVLEAAKNSVQTINGQKRDAATRPDEVWMGNEKGEIFNTALDRRKTREEQARIRRKQEEEAKAITCDYLNPSSRAWHPSKERGGKYERREEDGGGGHGALP